MKITLLILASVLLVLGIVSVYAVTSQPVTASVTVPGVVDISVSSSTLTWASMTPGTTAPPTPDPITITVTANKAYNVTTESASAFTGPAALAASALQFRNSTSGSWIGYSTTPVIVASGASASGATSSLYHQLIMPSGQLAGSYSLGLTVKLVA